MASADNVTPNYDRIKDLEQFDHNKNGVKGLKDSGMASIPKFFIQPPEVLSTLKPPPQTNYTGDIPIIDLENINSQTHHPEIVKQIKEAAKEWGFFQVINHGIPISILEKTIQAVKSFHEQPDEVKTKYYGREMKSGFAYSSNVDLYNAKTATWHDYLHHWMAPEELAAKLEDIPDIMREEAVAWDVFAKRLAEDVMELLCEGIGLESSKFKELSCSCQRLFVGGYYPYCPQPDLTLGLAPHTDSGTITVLLTNQISGLQIKHEEEWVDVKPLPEAVIINIADLLQIISNGEYNSVEHRVRANTCQEARISVTEFFNLTKWKEYGSFGPLPELVSKEKPALYRQFTEHDYYSNLHLNGLECKSMVWLPFPNSLSTLKPPSQTNTGDIPVIDLENINSEPHRPKIVEQIKEAAKEWGFFQVINHGIPISVMEETIQAVKSFHEQPDKVKAKYYNRAGGVAYSSNIDLYRAKAATCHDYLHLWMAPEERAAKVEEIPEIVRKEAVAWDGFATKLAEDVMELLSEGLGLESSRFKELSCSGLKFILGLQVKHGQEWVDVKPLPGAIVINIADLLQIISNGEYNSVQHRVRANSCQEARISVAEFFGLSKWKEYGTFGPLPELVSAEKPALYRQFREDDFYSNLHINGLESKTMVEKFKL
ncbi:Oxoglutarate/iron-dependent dioxygenase [Corchorus capsularis]|uniref:Oxoglutarate/iron-dependent dioxygenase n=1 Tax=Corchorus capsularis TaxID=210143 RepID=A0A1R3IIB8_COCAP|nr:Oxoglutarate/iron-dependent dioxygenase [Corchorus capsularis]